MNAKTFLNVSGGSRVSSSRAGSHGLAPNASRTPMIVMISPSGVESPGSGIGVQKGSESSITSST